MSHNLSDGIAFKQLASHRERKSDRSCLQLPQCLGSAKLRSYAAKLTTDRVHIRGVCIGTGFLHKLMQESVVATCKATPH